jgi:hypothetical protein
MSTTGQTTEIEDHRETDETQPLVQSPSLKDESIFLRFWKGQIKPYISRQKGEDGSALLDVGVRVRLVFVDFRFDTSEAFQFDCFRR